MWNYQPLQLRIIGRSFLFMWSWSGPTIGTHIIIIWKRSTITNIKVLTEGCLTQQYVPPSVTQLESCSLPSPRLTVDRMLSNEAALQNVPLSPVPPEPIDNPNSDTNNHIDVPTIDQKT